MKVDFPNNRILAEEYDNTWDQVLALLSKKLRKPSFNTWIRPTKLIDLNDQYATIAVKNEFARNFIKQSFLDQIRDVVKEVLAKSIAVRIVVDESLVFNEEKDSSNDPVQPSLASVSERNSNHLSNTNSNKALRNTYSQYKTNLSERLNFENYVIGGFNRFAHSVAQKVAHETDPSYNPVVFASDVGLGKTHLLHAIGNEVYKNSPDKKVRYVNSESFTNELVKAIRSNSTHEFRKKYRDVDLLLMDDIHFFEGKSASQEEFYHTFNSVVDNGGQLIASSNKALESMSGIAPNVKSRLSGGLVTEITKPEYETKLAILERKTAEEEIAIEANALRQIAQLNFENLRELEGALTRINAYSSFTDEVIDDELISQLFGAVSHPVRYAGLSIDKIAETVAQYFAISLEDLVGLRRVADFTYARHIAIYLTYELLQLSYSRIGMYFSNRKHSSIIYSIKTIRSKLENDRSIRLMVEDIKSKFL